MKAIPTLYKGIQFRSRLEADWAATFDSYYITWEYEPEGYQLSDGEWYLPDFWLPSSKAWFEVKGDHEERLTKVEQFARELTREWQEGIEPCHHTFSCRCKRLRTKGTKPLVILGRSPKRLPVPAYLEVVYEYVPDMIALTPNRASVCIYRCPKAGLGFFGPPTLEWCPACDVSVDYDDENDPHSLPSEYECDWQSVKFDRWVQGVDQFIRLPRPLA